jgi:hypothetical protein
MTEARDRYGPPPPSVLNLAAYGTVRILADRLGVETIDREGKAVVFKFRPEARVEPAVLIRLVHQRPSLRLIPPAMLRLDLLAPEAPPTRAATPAPARTRGAPGRTRPGEPAASWWTARATAGEVRPGFTKAEITRVDDEDPRGPSGVLTKVSAVLVGLSGGETRPGAGEHRV